MSEPSAAAGGPMSEWKAGDEVLFYGTRYALLEPSGAFGWFACATDDPRAKPRIILTEHLKRAAP